MRFFNLLSAAACLAGFASALQHDFGSKLAARDGFEVIQRDVTSGAAKACPHKPFRRADSAADEDIGGIEYVWMGGHETVANTKTISVAGVNGCTAAFFFGGSKVTAAHLSAGDEVAEAGPAAAAAISAGTTSSVVVRAPDAATATAVQHAIAAKLPHASIKATDYPYRSKDNDCWEFIVKKGTTSVTEKWQKQ